MEVLICSDIHDNLANLRIMLDYAKKRAVSELLFCGDLTNPETLEMMAASFPGHIHLVRGNADSYDAEDVRKYSNIYDHGEGEVFLFAGYRIGLCHEPRKKEELLLGREKPAIVFFGHTHRPWLEKMQGVSMINPGTVAGTISPPTFALWDSDKASMQLVRIDEIKRPL